MLAALLLVLAACRARRAGRRTAAVGWTVAVLVLAQFLGRLAARDERRAHRPRAGQLAAAAITTT